MAAKVLPEDTSACVTFYFRLRSRHALELLGFSPCADVSTSTYIRVHAYALLLYNKMDIVA